MADLHDSKNWLMFGKYEPTRWDRIKRRIPRVRVWTKRDLDGGRVWNARRVWLNGATADACGYTLRFVLRNAILKRRPGRKAFTKFYEIHGSKTVASRPHREDEAHG